MRYIKHLKSVNTKLALIKEFDSKFLGSRQWRLFKQNSLLTIRPATCSLYTVSFRIAQKLFGRIHCKLTNGVPHTGRYGSRWAGGSISALHLELKLNWSRFLLFQISRTSPASQCSHCLLFSTRPKTQPPDSKYCCIFLYRTVQWAEES
jgi:hypothetical protein